MLQLQVTATPSPKLHMAQHLQSPQNAPQPSLTDAPP